MTNALIQLAYRQVIDASARNAFELDVFHDSYQEFLQQSQTYNPGNQFTTWQQIRQAIAMSEVPLQAKVGQAIDQCVHELHNKIPGLTDTLGQPVFFTNYRFALLDSDLADKAKHRIALTYLTDTLVLVGTIGNYLLLTSAAPPEPAEESPAVALDTFMVEMQPNLSIVSHQSR